MSGFKININNVQRDTVTPQTLGYNPNPIVADYSKAFQGLGNAAAGFYKKKLAADNIEMDQRYNKYKNEYDIINLEIADAYKNDDLDMINQGIAKLNELKATTADGSLSMYATDSSRKIAKNISKRYEGDINDQFADSLNRANYYKDGAVVSKQAKEENKDFNNRTFELNNRIISDPTSVHEYEYRSHLLYAQMRYDSSTFDALHPATKTNIQNSIQSNVLKFTERYIKGATTREQALARANMFEEQFRDSGIGNTATLQAINTAYANWEKPEIDYTRPRRNAIASIGVIQDNLTALGHINAANLEPLEAHISTLERVLSEDTTLTTEEKLAVEDTLTLGYSMLPYDQIVETGAIEDTVEKTGDVRLDNMSVFTGDVLRELQEYANDPSNITVNTDGAISNRYVDKAGKDKAVAATQAIVTQIIGELNGSANGIKGESTTLNTLFNIDMSKPDDVAWMTNFIQETFPGAYTEANAQLVVVPPNFDVPQFHDEGSTVAGIKSVIEANGVNARLALRRIGLQQIQKAGNEPTTRNQRVFGMMLISASELGDINDEQALENIEDMALYMSTTLQAGEQFDQTTTFDGKPKMQDLDNKLMDYIMNQDDFYKPEILRTYEALSKINGGDPNVLEFYEDMAKGMLMNILNTEVAGKNYTVASVVYKALGGEADSNDKATFREVLNAYYKQELNLPLARMGYVRDVSGGDAVVKVPGKYVADTEFSRKEKANLQAVGLGGPFVIPFNWLNAPIDAVQDIFLTDQNLIGSGGTYVMEELLKTIGVDPKFMPGLMADITHESMASLIVEDYDVSFVSSLEENLTSGKGNIPAALRQIMPDLDFNGLNEEQKMDAILNASVKTAFGTRTPAFIMIETGNTADGEIGTLIQYYDTRTNTYEALIDRNGNPVVITERRLEEKIDYHLKRVRNPGRSTLPDDLSNQVTEQYSIRMGM
jgi:hypothetical protein